LVHDAWMKIFHSNAAPEFACRNAFFAYAARAMRSLLVDHVRRRNAQRHGGQVEWEPLDDFVDQCQQLTQIEFLALNDALEALKKHDEQLFQIVEMSFFGGMKHKEIAEQLGITAQTVGKKWVVARAWLYRRLK